MALPRLHQLGQGDLSSILLVLQLFMSSSLIPKKICCNGAKRNHKTKCRGGSSAPLLSPQGGANDSSQPIRVLMSVAVGILLVVSAILLWLDWDNHSKFNEEYESNSSESGISLLEIICHLRGFKSIASSIRNQWRGSRRWKGVLRLRRFGERNRSNHSVALQANASDTTSDTAVSYTMSSEKLP